MRVNNIIDTRLRPAEEEIEEVNEFISVRQ
jgi:hypothetical protein